MSIVDIHAHWYWEDCLVELARHCPEIELDRAPDGQRLVRWRGAVWPPEEIAAVLGGTAVRLCGLRSEDR